MANYEISTEEITTRRGKTNVVNIKFEGKPSEEVRNILKAHHYKWFGSKGVWYGFTKVEEIKEALGESVDYEEPKEKSAPAPKEVKKGKGTEVKVWFKDLEMYVTVSGTAIDAYDVVAVKVGKVYKAVDAKSGRLFKMKAETLKALKAQLEEKEADINAFRMSNEYKAMVA